MAKVMDESVKLSGRHGDLVYVRRGDCYFVRAYVPHLSKKPTEEQKKGQGRFAMCGMVYDFLEQEMKRILKTCMKGHSCSGRNLFISLNYHAMVPGREEPDYQQMRFSQGRRRLPNDLRLQPKGGGRWELTWVNPDWETSMKGDDRLYVVELHPEWPQSPRLVKALEAVRSDGRAVFDSSQELGEGEVYFYCFFGNPDETEFSDTAYLGGWQRVEVQEEEENSAGFTPQKPVSAQRTDERGCKPAFDFLPEKTYICDNGLKSLGYGKALPDWYTKFREASRGRILLC